METFDTNLSKGSIPTKKNSKFLSLAGDFLRNESTIQIDPTHFLRIMERKEYTPTKPRFFLVLKVGDSENYVSSLYPTKKPKIFHADYIGSKYELDFSQQNRVKIRARSSTNLNE